ncbi:nucleoside recognition domain-containing protein [Exiguobacterium qingdaonense]|uniref:nucleoside recognition domain-containing protein n=1 Tax=Exiguobacterium qingdaonense TaxID=2751251 RepID=UPI001BEA8108|nr:nucleoside recognition domain-containing protein [Exiguobacterium qingdaonense]
MQVALIGLESSGKSSLLYRLSEYKTARGMNQRGSTTDIVSFETEGLTFHDMPGLRHDSDVERYRQVTDEAAVHVIFARAHQLIREWKRLERVMLSGKRILLVISHIDRLDVDSLRRVEHQLKKRKIPHVLLQTSDRTWKTKLFFKELQEARELSNEDVSALTSLYIKQTDPMNIFLRHPVGGIVMAALTILLLYGLPVVLAYQVASRLEPFVDRFVEIGSTFVTGNFLSTMLFGDFGLLSLGLYSFVWAFPVVVLLGVTVGVTDDTGLKDKLADALDPIMRKIGLSGQDLIPFLGGFGCNVTALDQTKGCHACTQKNCASLISIGSACSYQMGATLSVFGAIGKPMLVFPYVFSLLVISLIHLKLFARKDVPIFWRHETFLQLPQASNVLRHVRDVVAQFMIQAMPLFLLICLVAGLLDWSGWIETLETVMDPILSILQLPAIGATALFASIIRKDGILLLNESAATMTTVDVFLLVLFASLATSCLVTMSKMVQLFGWRHAMKTIALQFMTAFVAIFLLSNIL